jgi:Reverse transcriptase (RNA-dependent DNA polymerase)
MKQTTFSNFLLNLVNESIMSGEVPKNWKTSVINPIPKVNNPAPAEEYRPINMLPITEKILESAIKSQLMAFIDKHNILIDQQSGFRKSHSCETAINLMLAKWMDDIQADKEILAIFLDFKRAFETIDRVLLLDKLKRIGFDDGALRWFTNYLSDRTQCVKIGDAFSSQREVKIGLVQGSILSPILFVLYINDINSILHHSSINLFADDTTLSVADKNPEVARIKLMEDLSILEDWLRFNKLALNVNKTCFFLINNKRNSSEEIELSINSEQIKQVRAVKYLGVKIDEKLSFLPHHCYIKSKLTKKLGLMRRINDKLSKESRLTFYKTIVAPHLDFCSTILFLLSDQQLEELQRVQNKFMRLILKTSREAHINDMLQQLNISSVREQIHKNTINFLFKVEQKIAPRYLDERMITRETTCNYPIRSGLLFELPKYKKTLTQNSLFYKGIKMYNNFLSSTKITDYDSFFIESLKYVKSMNRRN